MGRTRRYIGRAPRPGTAQRTFRLLLGLALGALACLGIAASRDARTVSLHEFAQLTHSESVLMSCADGVTTSNSSLPAEPQWCSDPSSPLCRPAAPPAPRLELWDPPQLTLLAQPQLPQVSFVWLPWPRPEGAVRPPVVAPDRLDRPPRA